MDVVHANLSFYSDEVYSYIKKMLSSHDYESIYSFI